VNIPSLKRGPTWLCLPVAGITSAIYLLEHIVSDTISLVKRGDI